MAEGGKQNPLPQPSPQGEGGRVRTVNGAVVMSCAVVLDLVVGDPPNRWHPVAWMGSLIGRLRRELPTKRQVDPFFSGAAIVFGGGGAVWLAGVGIERLPLPVRTVLTVAALKSTLSLSGLVKAGTAVKAALAQDDLVEARRLVSWHLVSRDTSTLDEYQIAAATIESLAENLSDGVLAPLFYFVVGGLPAALAYRYVNTCDAMLGYRDAEREWLGKVPARMDDMLNLVPARLTALGIWAAAGFSAEAWRIYQRDKGQTDSPNAGHPMSMAAGVLGVVLDKVGQYALGAGQRQPEQADIGEMIGLLYRTTAIGAVAIGLLQWRKA